MFGLLYSIYILFIVCSPWPSFISFISEAAFLPDLAPDVVSGSAPRLSLTVSSLLPALSGTVFVLTIHEVPKVAHWMNLRSQAGYVARHCGATQRWHWQASHLKFSGTSTNSSELSRTSQLSGWTDLWA